MPRSVHDKKTGAAVADFRVVAVRLCLFRFDQPSFDHHGQTFKRGLGDESVCVNGIRPAFSSFKESSVVVFLEFAADSAREEAWEEWPPWRYAASDRCRWHGCSQPGPPGR